MIKGPSEETTYQIRGPSNIESNNKSMITIGYQKICHWELYREIVKITSIQERVTMIINMNKGRVIRRSISNTPDIIKRIIEIREIIDMRGSTHSLQNSHKIMKEIQDILTDTSEWVDMVSMMTKHSILMISMIICMSSTLTITIISILIDLIEIRKLILQTIIDTVSILKEILINIMMQEIYQIIMRMKVPDIKETNNLGDT